MYQRSLEGRAMARPREELQEEEELTAYRRDSLRLHSTTSLAKRRKTNQHGERDHRHGDELVSLFV